MGYELYCYSKGRVIMEFEEILYTLPFILRSILFFVLFFCCCGGNKTNYITTLRKYDHYYVRGSRYTNTCTTTVVVVVGCYSNDDGTERSQMILCVCVVRSCFDMLYVCMYFCC